MIGKCRFDFHHRQERLRKKAAEDLTQERMPINVFSFALNPFKVDAVKEQKLFYRRSLVGEGHGLFRAIRVRNDLNGYDITILVFIILSRFTGKHGHKFRTIRAVPGPFHFGNDPV